MHSATASLGDALIGDHATSRWSRIRARLQGARLDAQLSAGAPPASRPELAARARLLTGRPCREALAKSFEDVVRAADRPPRLDSRAPLNVRGIQAARTELVKLAADLREGHCEPRGVARCRQLLTDGTGPLYGLGDGRDLSVEIRHARVSLRLRESR